MTLVTSGVESNPRPPGYMYEVNALTTRTASQQHRYTHVVIAMLVSILCLCLASWFLVPQLVRSVTTPITRPPDPTPLPPTYDPRIDELVKEVERCSRMQTKMSASFYAFRNEVAEQIQANADTTNAFEYSLSSLKDSVEEETTSLERFRLEFEKKVSDVKTEIDDIDTRRVNIQKEARQFENNLVSLERNQHSLRQEVQAIRKELKVDAGLASKFKNLYNNAEIQESHMKSVLRILTTPDVDPLRIAVAVPFILVLYMWYLISTINRQQHHVVQSTDRTEIEYVSRHEPSILERVAVPRRLDNTVCILGFYKSSLELRNRLTESVLESGIKQTHFLLDSHENIVRLPACRLFFVFVDNNESHVILEDPSLGMGDLRLTTVRAIEKMGASVVVIYYGDHESRNIGDHLFNRRLTSVHHQSELSALCKRDRFFSTANKFTDRQIHALKNAVDAEIN